MIEADVDVALRSGVARAYACRPGNPTEPELVAGVFAAGIPELATRLSRSAPGARLAGVFCHARPMATKLSDPSWKCEVGDLLVVSRYDDGIAVRRSALLLQVKKPPVKFAHTGKPARQVELYERWPIVEVFGIPRDVDSRPHRGAQFSFWDVCGNASSSCTDCKWDQRVPGTTFEQSLAHEIAETMVARGGRPFTDYEQAASGGDDWSGLIWDLLKQSLHYAWSVANSRHTGRSRTWDDGVFLVKSSPEIPKLLADTELGGVARELWRASSTEIPPDLPPLNSDMLEVEQGGGGIPIMFTEVPGPIQRSE